MILTVVRIALLRLTHSVVECAVIFVVPVVFFTVFAMIFSRQTGGSGPVTPIVVCDLDESEASRRLVDELVEQEALEVVERPAKDGDAPRVSVAWAEHLVESGRAKAAVVVPRDYEASLKGKLTEPLQLEMLSDSSDPIAEQTVRAAVAQLVVKARLEGLTRSLRRPETSPTSPPAERSAATVDPRTGDGSGGERQLLPAETVPTEPGTEGATTRENGLAEDAPAPLVSIEIRDVLAERKSNPKVSMHAAGIAVMFLLFSAVGSAGTLLEEEETGTLERLLCTRLSMSGLLLGKWLFLVALGCVQVTVMFVWGQLVFAIDLLGHLAGFALMTLVTSAAAASFALVLATACRTRTQLNGVAVIVILCMSALGGSMVPRYVMSDRMQEIGLVTFNAWALDGYNKVFWRELPLAELAPQVLVLAASALVFLLIARILARRWESV